MAEVQLSLNERQKGRFYIMEEGKQVAEMVVGIAGTHLTAYHTEVVKEAEGKGLAKLLFQEMVNYVRHNGLKVIPLCPYVLAQFQRHPEDYADIWEKQAPHS